MAAAITPPESTSGSHDSVAAEKRLSLSELEEHPKLGNNRAYSHIYHISPDKVAKTGPSVTPAEASAMRLAKDRGIPVPTILDIYQDPETTWWVIIMSHIPGDSLDILWDTLSEPSKTSILRSLRTVTSRLRSAKPRRYIGSVDMTGVPDTLFLPRYSGPFVNETEFTSGLAQSLLARQEGGWMRLLERMLMALPSHGEEFFFTHGRLNPQNILVRDGEVVGLLDWGEAGFYPRYWETVKACFWHADVDFFLGAVEEGVLEEWPSELSLMLHVRDVVF